MVYRLWVEPTYLVGLKEYLYRTDKPKLKTQLNCTFTSTQEPDLDKHTGYLSFCRALRAIRGSLNLDSRTEAARGV